ncbi:MAG TPA: hypothetical protein VMF09_15430 [Solirubrobacteraceae bacterium]|nr:hypothetical protein [Solirubrobacteraceae bacterium]
MSVGSICHTPVARGGVLTLTAMLASAGIALAAKQVKGAVYTGHWTGASVETISFKVSSNGRRVIDLSVTTPFKCSGGCGGVGRPNQGSARISSQGKFSATLEIPSPGSTSKSEGTDTITGEFHAHGTASGKVTSHFNAGDAGTTTSWIATD